MQIIREQLFRTTHTTTMSSSLIAAFRRLPAAPRQTVLSAVQQVRFYDSKVIDHYENPRNVGTFDKKDTNVGTGIVGAPACGDVMKFQIKVDCNGKIVDSCFKVQFSTKKNSVD